jgi:predicted dehydrogenase
MALRHGVIGCGMVAGYGHLPAVERCEELELLAVCDSDAQRRAEASARYNVPGFDDARRMFEQTDLDSVTICTPMPTHAALGQLAAEAGVHCYCEKPMAPSGDQADAMVQAFEDAGKLLAINFEFRVSPMFAAVKRDIETGRIGRLVSMRFVFNWDNHWHRPEIRPRRAAFLDQGFGSLDCGVHYLDMARHLTGQEFERLSAEGAWVDPEPYTYPGHIHILGRLTGGTMVSIEQSFAYTLGTADRLTRKSCDVIGETGVIYIERDPADEYGTRAFRHFADHTSVEPTDEGKPWDAAYAEFARIAARAQSGTPAGDCFADSPLATGRDGAVNIHLVEQILARCEAGRMDG